jgi:RNA polymerase sigma-70 factor (ECF subfamily)
MQRKPEPGNSSGRETADPQAGSRRRRAPKAEVDPGRLTELHRRVVAGSRDALNVVAEDLLPILNRRLRGAFRMVPQDAISDAAVDAIMDYISRPTRFDPARGRLDAFLFQAAWRNVSDSLESIAARISRETRYAHAASLLAPPVLLTSDHDSAGSGVEDPDLDTLLQVLARDERSSEVERVAVRLWAEGERRSEVFAALLGLDHRPPDEQRREVKRFKDRLVKRLRRLWERRVHADSVFPRPVGVTAGVALGRRLRNRR